jgi:hypothetical protein
MTTPTQEVAPELGRFEDALAQLDKWNDAYSKDLDKLAKIRHATATAQLTPEVWQAMLELIDYLLRNGRKLINSSKQNVRHQRSLIQKARQAEAFLRRTVCNTCGRALGFYEPFTGGDQRASSPSISQED